MDDNLCVLYFDQVGRAIFGQAFRFSAIVTP